MHDVARKSPDPTSTRSSRARARGAAAARAGVLALAVAFVAMVAPHAHAQQRNNDYYNSRGTKLLYDVEKFHLNQGEEKMRAKRYDAAFDDFKFMLGYYPNHPQALLFVSQNCEVWKSPVCEMDDIFAAAIAVRPNAAATHVLYGIHLLRTGKVAAAVDSLERAITLDPGSVNAHYNLGLAYLDAKKFDLANAHAQRAYALGASLPGLRERLKRANQWRPDAAPVAGATGMGEAAAAPKDGALAAEAAPPAAPADASPAAPRSP